MAYKYKHFIPQNIAPKGAKQIGVYNSKGNKVTNIPLGRLTAPTATPLNSFGLVSDIHLWETLRPTETATANSITLFHILKAKTAISVLLQVI